MVEHGTREHAPASTPHHVTLRVREDVESLRQPRVLYAVHESIAKAQREQLRIVHFSVQSTHLHLIIEAANDEARARGIQGLVVRLARSINRTLQRRGPLFSERYHARALRTPREVRNAIRYVLNNARHHMRHDNPHVDATWVDAYSSGLWFEGWKRPVVVDHWSTFHVMQRPNPVVTPRVWLLAKGWRRHGLLQFDEVPG
jgi:REP element-mobilizing transposase RayT